jgi:hypothetical protein
MNEKIEVTAATAGQILSRRTVVGKDYMLRLHGEFGGSTVQLEAWDGDEWIPIEGATDITENYHKVYECIGSEIRVVADGGAPNFRAYIDLKPSN